MESQNMAGSEDQFQPDEEELLRKAFELFDFDKNGTICATELRTVLQCVGKDPSKTEIKNLLTEFDKNGDGVLDFEEFVIMFRYFRGKGGKDQLEQELKHAFEIFDVDGDGLISASELRHVMMNCGETFTEEEAESFISSFDTNKDGLLDWQEFVVFYKQTLREFLKTLCR